jgi:hypothetical protein
MKKVVVALFSTVGALIFLMFAIIGLDAVLFPSRPAQPEVSVAWRREELQQAAAIRMYGSMLISARECRRRTIDWSEALLDRIKAAIPPGRDDLSEQMEIGKNAGEIASEQGPVGAQYCNTMARGFENADHVIRGEQGIFAPLLYDKP